MHFLSSASSSVRINQQFEYLRTLIEYESCLRLQAYDQRTVHRLATRRAELAFASCSSVSLATIRWQGCPYAPWFSTLLSLIIMGLCFSFYTFGLSGTDALRKCISLKNRMLTNCRPIKGKFSSVHLNATVTLSGSRTTRRSRKKKKKKIPKR